MPASSSVSRREGQQTWHMTRLLDAAFGMATTTAIQLAAASVPSWPIAASRHRRQLARRRTWSSPVQAAGKLGLPKQLFPVI